ncbi:MAG: hypothetical protein K0Q79_561 [Flavipsychrobacter sp.]|jgi:hypothetical protein|nr:hypothetical protein [Flavipsychrobacter sp.]
MIVLNGVQYKVYALTYYFLNLECGLDVGNPDVPKKSLWFLLFRRRLSEPNSIFTSL